MVCGSEIVVDQTVNFLKHARWGTEMDDMSVSRWRGDGIFGFVSR